MKHPKLQKMVLLILILVMVSLLAGCVRVSAAETQPRQLLVLSPTAGEMPEGTFTYPRFTSEELNGNYDGTLYYSDFTQVSITLDGKTLPLEDAIRQNLLYGESLQAMAQADARNGFCVESSYTENGKTCFYYRYDNYNLEIINDVYETPDGKAYLLRETWIKPSAVPAKVTRLEPLDPDRDPFDLIDKEDWGLTLTVTQSTPTGLTLHCAQTGGQQFGTLKACEYQVYSYAEDQVYYPAEELNQSLSMDGTTEFSIQWDQAFGQLPKGEYLLRLYIQDVYQPEDVPPLSRDFHNRQMYPLTFHIE